MIDDIDLKIINALLRNSRERTINISKLLRISNVATQQRIEKLEKQGIIQAYTAAIDLQKLGFRTTAYLGIFLEKAKHYQDVICEIREIPNVLEAHFTTGTYSIFAKVYAKDNRHLMEILNQKIQNIDGVSRTETFISLDEGIKSQIQIMPNQVL